MNVINFAKKKIITLTVLVSVLLLSVIGVAFSLKTVSAEESEESLTFAEQVAEIKYGQDEVGGFLVDYTKQLDSNIEKSDLKRTVTAERDLVADDVDFENCSFIKSLPYAGVSYVQVDDYEGYLENIYAYSQATQRGDGLVVEEEQELAYVVSAFYVGDYKNAFANFVVNVNGEFLAGDGACLIQVSCDNEQWENVKESDVAAEIFGVDIDLTQYVTGSKYIYVRIAFKNALIKGLNKVDYFFSNTLILKEMDNLTVDFSNTDEKFFKNMNADGELIKGLIATENVKLQGNKLTSDEDDWSSLVFKIDGGNDFRAIKQITPNLNLTVKENAGSEVRFLTFEMSFDNGATYKTVSSSDKFKFEDLDFDGETSLTNQFYYTFVDGEVNGSALDGLYDENGEFITNPDGTSIVDGVVEELVNGAASVLLRINFYNCDVNGVDVKVVFNDLFDQRTYSYKIYDLNGGVETSDPLKPQKSGCKFVGWYYNDVKVDPTSAEFDDGEFVFKAKWKTIQHNITYVLNGGKNAKINVATITENEFIILGPAAKDGKAFAGWYDKDGNKVTKLEGSKVSSDLVLYAVYTDYIDDEGGCAGSFNAIYLAFVLVPVACVLVFVRTKKHNN